MSNVTLENKTILVTGAAGFIGSNLVKRIYQEAPSATVIGMLHRKKSRPCGWGDSQRTGARADPLFVLAEILMKKLSGIVGKIYE